MSAPRQLEALARRLAAQPDAALARALFDAALRAASAPHLRCATAALLADASVAGGELCRCARRVAESALDPRSAWRLVRGAIERGEAVSFQLGPGRLELEDVVILVDVPAVQLVEPVALLVPWESSQRHRLMLACARHVVALYERAEPDDDTPRRVIGAVADAWGLRDEGEGAPRSTIDLDAARVLSDTLWGVVGADQLGQGLRYMIDDQATLALEAFRELRAHVAGAEVWACFEADGETLLGASDDPLIERAVRSTLDDERERFGELGTSSSVRATIEARRIAEHDELHWQVDQILRHLLG